MEINGFFQFEIIMNVLVSSIDFVLVSSFEYLSDGSTTIINIFILTARGSPLDVRIWRLQTSDSDD